MSFTVGVAIGMACLSFVFAYLSINMFNEYRFIRMFFLTMCMIFMTLTMGVFVESANINSATNLENMMTTMMTSMMVISSLLIMVMVLLGFISAFNIWRGKDLDEDYDKEGEQKGLF